MLSFKEFLEEDAPTNSVAAFSAGEGSQNDRIAGIDPILGYKELPWGGNGKIGNWIKEFNRSMLRRKYPNVIPKSKKTR